MKLEYIIKSLVLLTTVLCFLFLGNKKKLHVCLKCILTVCAITEACGLLLKDTICTCYSISFIFHNTLWLLALKQFYAKKWFGYAIGLYVLFSIGNLFFIEGMANLNYNIFTVGAFMYVMFFVYLSFYELKRENLNFFTANSYIALSAPIMLFLGFSFLFGFGDLHLLTIKIGGIAIYNLIQFVINIIYYVTLIIYILKEKGAKDV